MELISSSYVKLREGILIQSSVVNRQGVSYGNTLQCVRLAIIVHTDTNKEELVKLVNPSTILILQHTGDLRFTTCANCSNHH